MVSKKNLKSFLLDRDEEQDAQRSKTQGLVHGRRIGTLMKNRDVPKVA